MAKPDALPPRLYKYRSMLAASRPFTESIFRKNQVWYAQASTFNDPFDCDHYIDIERDSEEWREIMDRFEKQFAKAVALVPGVMIQQLWNAIAEHINEKNEGKTDVRLPVLTKDRLLDVIERVGEQSEANFGGRVPRELVDDENFGPQKLNDVLDRYLEQSKAAIDERFGVFSLATSAKNILMWSHYADDHSGICIEFDTEAHPQAFPNLHAVEYKEQSPVIEKRFANVLMNLKSKEPSLDDAFLARIAKKDIEAEWTDKEIRSWFLTKSTLWEYEKEWRSIDTEPGLKRVPAAAISGVVLGAKASAETEEAVRSWVSRRRRKVKIYRARKVKGAFALDLDAV